MALWCGLFGGAVGVLVDVDHIVCAVFLGMPIDPTINAYGCRLWHPLLIPGAGAVLFAYLALYLGLWTYFIYYATKPAAGIDNAVNCLHALFIAVPLGLALPWIIHYWQARKAGKRYIDYH